MAKPPMSPTLLEIVPEVGPVVNRYHCPDCGAESRFFTKTKAKCIRCATVKESHGQG